MEFAKPEHFIWLWLVPFGALFVLASIKLRQRRLHKLAKDSSLRRIAPRYQMGAVIFKAVLVSLSIAATIVALCEPRYGFEWQEVKRKGVDIMVALDVSQSMKAEDIKPNRLDRARREIIDLIRMLKGDRIGLIAFAGVGFVQCPLTTDYKAVQMFLDHIDADLIPIPGTSLGDAIKLGAKSLSEGSEGGSQGKAIILITDGEDQDSSPLEAASDAAKKGIKIFTIGMGQEGGAPIPLAEGGFKKDQSGQMIVTKLGETTLRQIADQAGGYYVRSTTGDLDLKRIYDEGIRGGLKQGEIKSSRQKIWYDRGHLFALLGFLLLFVAQWIPDVRKRVG